MKKILLFFAVNFCVLWTPVAGQEPAVDSLARLIAAHPSEDTVQVNLLNNLAFELQDLDTARTRQLSEKALRISRDLSFLPGQIRALRRLGFYYYNKGEYETALRVYEQDKQVAILGRDSASLAWAYNGIGTVFHSQSDYPQALQNYLQSVSVFEKIGKPSEAASIMGNAGVLYKEMGELNSALTYFEKGLKIQEALGNKSEIARFLNNVGNVYTDQRRFREAEETYMRCLSIAEADDNKHMLALVLRNLVELKGLEDKNAEAIPYGHRSLALYKSIGEVEGIADASYAIALIYMNMNKPDSAMFYARQSIKIAKEIGFKRNIQDTYDVLAHAYAAKKEFAQAYDYQQLSNAYKDSLTGEAKQNLVGGLKFQYELDKKQSEIALLTKDKELQTEYANHQRLKIYALLAGLALVVLLAGILIRTNRQKQRANALLLMQKEEIDGQARRLQQLINELSHSNDQLAAQTSTVTAQRDHLERALDDLKSTQVQLIHREKMASLGELTAGIAHEIQNPLNFVNNFSDLNVELLHEMENEFRARNQEAGMLIAEDIKQNLIKIAHHGKRADGIVKSMLQHSSGGIGQREPTEINSLADEFLRLAYHGQRARNKTLQASLHTDLDGSLGKINIVPQDISRVLLNMYNNAFYALMEKQQKHGNGFEPGIWLSTKKIGNKAEIRIRDNGTGLPEKIRDKVFQPFFTTKPAGKGTGLGLSLSYDIIVKNHGGECEFLTREGEFTEFIVTLPIS